ncbi:hypothetical protein AB6A23_02350 [Paenibacillus tarimensis]
MKMNKRLLLVLAFALMLIGAGCSAANEGGTGVNAPADNSTGVEQNDSAVEPEGGVQEDGAPADTGTEDMGTEDTSTDGASTP